MNDKQGIKNMNKEEILNMFNTQNVELVIFSNPSLFANSASGDFEKVYIVFENDCIEITYRFICINDNNDEEVELVINKFNKNDCRTFNSDLKLAIALKFMRFLYDEYNHFAGIELRFDNNGTSNYMFIMASANEIVVTVQEDEMLCKELFDYGRTDIDNLFLLDEFPDKYINFF